MEQQRGALSQSSQMHSLPVFSHAIDQQQGPAVAVPVTMAMPPSMFHQGLWSGGDGGICSGAEGQFHMITNRDEECPIWAMQADVNGYTTSYDPVPVIPQVINLYSIAKNLNRKKPLQSAFKFKMLLPQSQNKHTLHFSRSQTILNLTSYIQNSIIFVAPNKFIMACTTRLYTPFVSWAVFTSSKKSTVQTKDSLSHQTCDICMEY
jgi:hypothetical protein